MNLQFTNLDVDSIHCMLKSICYIGSHLYIEINSLLKQLYIHVRKYSESHVFTLAYQMCVPKTYWLTSLKYDNISGIYIWSIFQFNRQTGILINCFLIIIKNKHLHSSLRFYFGGGVTLGLDVKNIPFWALTYIYRLHFPLVPGFMIGNLTKSFV